MPLYRFKTAAADGKLAESVAEGENPGDAERRLRSRGLTPLALLGEGEGKNGGSGGFFAPRFDAVDFTDRLVPLLEAGISLERSLSIVGETSEREPEKEMARQLRQGLHEGRRLSQLVRDRSNQFPRLYANAVEAGEEAGALPQVMAELRRHLLERRETRNFILSSSAYPVAVSFISLAVIAFLLGHVVPRFAAIFQNGHRKMGAATELLVGISNGLATWWPLLIVLSIAATSGLWWLLTAPSQNARRDALIIRLPFLGHLVMLMNTAILCRTMAVLLRSGVHLLKSVQIASRAVPHSGLGDSVAAAASRLRQGERLSEALRSCPLLPALVPRMLAVGEETGDVESMMTKVAERYDLEFRNRVKAMLALFEPLIIAVLAAVVGSVVIVMFLAIQELSNPK